MSQNDERLNQELDEVQYNFNSFPEIKQRGSDHYKTTGVEPLDLYHSGGMLWEFSLCSIIKYAFRCRAMSGRTHEQRFSDLEKIKHYADILIDRYGK